MRRAGLLALLGVSALGAALIPAAGAAPAPVVYRDPAAPIERRVDDLLARMTLEEKVGQMTQAERDAVADDPALVARWHLGSVLSGGGSAPTPNTPAAWVEMVNTLQAQALRTRLGIPLLYGIDAVHGHATVHGATVFPHNVGLGATRDPELAVRIGVATARELRATGVPWNFSPCVCVSRDERWGRTYESFGEDPALVSRMAAMVAGLQAGPEGVLATPKHYAGDGATTYGTGDSGYPIDQGVMVTSRADFERLAVAPYEEAVRRHGAGSAMPSFSSVDWTEDGVGDPVKMHAHRELITDRLKRDMGFAGFVVSDWEGIHQIPDPDAPGERELTPYKVRTGANAGIDLFMEPHTAPRFQELLLAEVRAGRVPVSRLDDAVRRILRAKFRLGLFERPFAPADRLEPVGSAAHRELAREAVARSQVLLKNRDGVVPLRRAAAIYVAGRPADDIGDQMGGWTITWQGVSGPDTQPGTTILDGIRSYAPDVTFSPDGSAPVGDADVGVVVVGETPYAEGFGDVGGPGCGWCPSSQREPEAMTPPAADRALVNRVCAAVPTCVVLVVSGRPLVLDGVDRMDALVASWLPGSEGAGVADVLFGRVPFTGRLPMTWPASEAQVPVNVGDDPYRPLFPFGWGLRTGAPAGPAVDQARDRAQAAVVAGVAPSDWAALIADADHALLTGDEPTALRLLARSGSG
jgi:beta-glucosidase